MGLDCTPHSHTTHLLACNIPFYPIWSDLSGQPPFTSNRGIPSTPGQSIIFPKESAQFSLTPLIFPYKSRKIFPKKYYSFFLLIFAITKDKGWSRYVHFLLEEAQLNGSRSALFNTSKPNPTSFSSRHNWDHFKCMSFTPFSSFQGKQVDVCSICLDIAVGSRKTIIQYMERDHSLCFIKLSLPQLTELRGILEKKLLCNMTKFSSSTLPYFIHPWLEHSERSPPLYPRYELARTGTWPLLMHVKT